MRVAYPLCEAANPYVRLQYRDWRDYAAPNAETLRTTLLARQGDQMHRWHIIAFLTALAVVVPAAPAHAASSLQFSTIVYNPSGPDTHSNTQINREYFTLKNHATRTKDLYGASVHDAQNHVYKFSTHFKLAAGASVRVHTGKGTNTSKDRYWGRSWYVWNNTGDKATLKSPSGAILDTCSWGNGSGTTSC